MRLIRDLSIRYKLMLMLVGVVSVVLLLSFAFIVRRDIENTESQMVNEYTALAKMIAADGPRAIELLPTEVEFLETTTAAIVVSKLRVDESIVFAALYDDEGTEVARYEGTQYAGEEFTPPAVDQARFTDDGFLEILEQFDLSGPEASGATGKVYLRVSTKRLDAGIRSHLSIAVAVFAVALLMTFLLSFVLQYFISKPILELASTTQRVSTEYDYSIRAEKRANDELGVLCDAFNAMLDQIQQRDRELEQHRTQLEKLVQERTIKLEEQTAQLTDSNEQLARSNEELDDFAYIVSHDLKEPLRGISNYSAFLAEDYSDKLDDAGREQLTTLQRLCQRQEDLINSLLHYSRVGRADLAIRETDLNSVINEVLELMDVMLKEQGVEVRVPQPLPAVQCDSVRIVEVFRNLITNAVKYNDKQEKWVEIGYQQNGQVDTGESADKNRLVFYIRDNGIGIREKHQDSVFRIFKRLHARDKFGGGTGAGLTFVKKILERHGGRIWLESTYGEGTTFYFTVQKEWSNDTKN